MDSPSNRWLVPVIGAMIVVLALATIYFVSGAPDGAAQPVRATAAVNAPLELVSLRQVRKGDTSDRIGHRAKPHRGGRPQAGGRSGVRVRS